MNYSTCVLALMLSSVPVLAKTVAEWKFSEPNASTPPSYTSQGESKIELTSRSVAQAPVPAPQKPSGFTGKSIDFTAQNRTFLQAANPDALNFRSNQAFTIEGWSLLRVPSNEPKQPRYLLFKRAPDDAKKGWALFVNDAVSGGASLCFYIHLGNRALKLDSKEPFPLHQWTHIAVTRNVEGHVQLFINGELKDSRAGYADSLENSGDLLIGRSLFSESSHNYWHGNLYQLRISDEALEPSAFQLHAP